MNSRSVLIIVVTAGIAFYAGYRLGDAQTNSMLTPLSSSDADNAGRQSSGQISVNGTTDSPTHSWLMPEKNNAKSDVLDEFSSQNKSLDTENSTEPTSTDYPWQDENDIVSMFNQLIALSEPNDDQDIDAFSKAIDELRHVLSNSPTQLAILLSHMQSLDIDSREFHYITAIVQGLPGELGYDAMENVALQLSQSDDPTSRQQFLHLVANSYNAADNPEILDSLVNIALYSEDSRETKLQALDLVMPFQVSNVERQQILSHLNGMLENAETPEINALMNNVLRFSNSEQREQLANNMIDANNSMEARYSVLDGLHSGVIPRSPSLKFKLLTVARDPNDPMREQAKHALMYVFDISNEEYQSINDLP